MKPVSSPRVVSVQICPGHRQPMQKLHAAQALTNLGLEGDRHAKEGGSRQVLFMPSEVLARLGIPVGAVKENITTQGIDLMALAKGTRLKIGLAVFEITKLCEPCDRMDEIRPGLQQELEGQRGMLARVVESGEVSAGDPIVVMPAVAPRPEGAREG